MESTQANQNASQTFTGTSTPPSTSVHSSSDDGEDTRLPVSPYELLADANATLQKTALISVILFYLYHPNNGKVTYFGLVEALAIRDHLFIANHSHSKTQDAIFKTADSLFNVFATTVYQPFVPGLPRDADEEAQARYAEFRQKHDARRSRQWRVRTYWLLRANGGASLDKLVVQTTERIELGYSTLVDGRISSHFLTALRPHLERAFEASFLLSDDFHRPERYQEHCLFCAVSENTDEDIEYSHWLWISDENGIAGNPGSALKLNTAFGLAYLSSEQLLTGDYEDTTTVVKPAESILVPTGKPVAATTSATTTAPQLHTLLESYAALES